MLILDFSGLGTLTPTQWNSYKITKRANANSAWVDVTTLGATIVNRQTDGVWGKFTITGLSSFSEFGLAEGYDGVLVSNLDESRVISGTPPTWDVDASNFAGQAFVTDGIRYRLTKAKVSVASNGSSLRARLYGSTSGGGVDNATVLAVLESPAQVGTTRVWELTPTSPTVKLEPNTQYWLEFYSSSATVVGLDYTASITETGPAAFPINLSSAWLDGDTNYTLSDTDPVMFSIEATEMTRTWNGSSSTSWTTAANWTPSETPGNGEILTIPNVTNPLFDPVLPTNASVAYLTIAYGAVVDLGSNTLTVTHGLSQDGTVTGTTGKLSLAGTAAQGIEGTGTIRNLEINNSSGVSIFAGSHMQSITGTLTPTLGTLTTNGNLTLKSSSAGTARGSFPAGIWCGYLGTCDGGALHPRRPQMALFDIAADGQLEQQHLL
jgi:hypothetical protein